MLLEIDRIQLAVPEVPSVVERWQSVLGAEILSTDSIKHLAASRTTLRLGTGIVEVLAADGAGLVADAIAARGAHMFGAGASCLDVGEVQSSLSSRYSNIVHEGGQLFIDGEDINIKGLRVVVSKHEERSKVGDIDFFYEATLLAKNSKQETAKFSDVFQLDAQEFVTIDSPQFGYSGTLTLFRKDLLHRFEVITPLDPAKTMGRFFSKIGACLYMAYAETADILTIERRVKERGEAITIDRPENRSDDKPADGLWLHPATLGGMMLGLSRPSRAWQWSGHPERVEEI
ncbi:MAG: hypothetical protein ABGY96_25435 [bacterium]|nr:hypothetical protein [Gammaproteobacteria bacterium]HIL99234.1 hypothetical protein [Pseudomonadales bacterium]